MRLEANDSAYVRPQIADLSFLSERSGISRHALSGNRSQLVNVTIEWVQAGLGGLWKCNHDFHFGFTRSYSHDADMFCTFEKKKKSFLEQNDADTSCFLFSIWATVSPPSGQKWNFSPNSRTNIELKREFFWGGFVFVVIFKHIWNIFTLLKQ